MNNYVRYEYERILAMSWIVTRCWKLFVEATCVSFIGIVFIWGRFHFWLNIPFLLVVCDEIEFSVPNLDLLKGGVLLSKLHPEIKASAIFTAHILNRHHIIASKGFEKSDSKAFSYSTRESALFRIWEWRCHIPFLNWTAQKWKVTLARPASLEMILLAALDVVKQGQFRYRLRAFDLEFEFSETISAWLHGCQWDWFYPHPPVRGVVFVAAKPQQSPHERC